ncbi:hypothetical protein [Silanimonas sp.]|uniref:hypothetical protein n=1 Tax=Silanimonas sp. TaxID=1929290 RepID=UPI0022C62391|nr:hypothetical protein [Silanimonas sp.]MCZ8166648.1 hypothetical protein [Silanimonas sp.]
MPAPERASETPHSLETLRFRSRRDQGAGESRWPIGASVLAVLAMALVVAFGIHLRSAYPLLLAATFVIGLGSLLSAWFCWRRSKAGGRPLDAIVVATALVLSVLSAFALYRNHQVVIEQLRVDLAADRAMRDFEDAVRSGFHPRNTLDTAIARSFEALEVESGLRTTVNAVERLKAHRRSLEMLLDLVASPIDALAEFRYYANGFSLEHSPVARIEQLAGSCETLTSVARGYASRVSPLPPDYGGAGWRALSPLLVDHAAALSDFAKASCHLVDVAGRPNVDAATAADVSAKHQVAEWRVRAAQFKVLQAFDLGGVRPPPNEHSRRELATQLPIFLAPLLDDAMERRQKRDAMNHGMDEMRRRFGELVGESPLAQHRGIEASLSLLMAREMELQAAVSTLRSSVRHLAEDRLSVSQLETLGASLVQHSLGSYSSRDRAEDWGALMRSTLADHGLSESQDADLLEPFLAVVDALEARNARVLTPAQDQASAAEGVVRYLLMTADAWVLAEDGTRRFRNATERAAHERLLRRLRQLPPVSMASGRSPQQTASP